MSINARRDNQFRRFCTIIGREEWIDDPRFVGSRQRVVNRDFLLSQIRPIIETKTSDEWNKLISDADILNAKVQTHADLFDDTQVQAVNAIRWVENDTLGRIPMANVPGQPIPETDDRFTHSPHIGEHNNEVLMELGYDALQIEELKANGVVGTFSNEC